MGSVEWQSGRYPTSITMIVKVLITDFLRDAIEKGTVSWDVTIQKVLSICILSATSVGRRDIALVYSQTYGRPGERTGSREATQNLSAIYN
jgi:hypothetical protein